MQVPQLGEGAEEMTKIRTWLRGLPGADAKDQGASYPEDIPELFRLLLIPGVRLWGSMCGGFCSSSFGPASAPNRVRGLPHRRSAVAWSAVPNRVRGLSHRRSVVAWSAVPNRVRGLPHRRSVVAWSAVPNRVRGLPERGAEPCPRAAAPSQRKSVDAGSHHHLPTEPCPPCPRAAAPSQRKSVDGVDAGSHHHLTPHHHRRGP